MIEWLFRQNNIWKLIFLSHIKGQSGDIVSKSVSGELLTITDAVARSFERFKVEIIPIQAGSGDPSPTNIRALSGTTEVRVVKTGENLVRPEEVSWVTGYRITAAGNIEKNSNYKYNETYIPVKSLATYKLIYNKPGTASYGFTVCVYDENKTFIKRFEVIGPNNNKGYMEGDLTTTEETKFIRFTAPKSTVTENIFISPSSTSVLLSLPFPEEAGTVWGGTLDVLTGVLEVDTAARDISTIAWNYSTTNPTPVFRGSPAGAYTGAGGSSVCSRYNFYGNGTSSGLANNLPDLNYGLQNTNGFIVIRDDTYNDDTLYPTAEDKVTAFQEANVGQYITFPLQTSLTYQLEPYQFRTTTGENNLTSSAYGVDVTYWGKESSDELNANEAMQLLLGNAYTRGASGDVTDTEALDIILGVNHETSGTITDTDDD